MTLRVHLEQPPLNVSLAQHPRHWAAARRDRPAAIFAGSGRVVTYGEMSARSNRCARRSKGVGQTLPGTGIDKPNAMFQVCQQR